MHKISKIAFLLLIVGMLSASLISLDSGEPQKTQVSTVKFDTEIKIDPRRMASSSILIAPYKTMDVFLSNEQTSSFDFTTVAGSWEEIAPQGTNVEAQVRFKTDGKWSTWLDMEEEDDLIEPDVKYGLASTNPAQAMQYKFIMYGDGINSPIIRKPQWTLINSAEVEVGGPPQPQFASFSQMALSTSKKNIISRSGWGADESYRYMGNNDVDPVLIAIGPDYYEKFKNELTYSRVVDKDASGNKYVWPLQYPQKVKKFVIHHTATTSNLNNPKQAIRDIYYYHSTQRRWGDIGYNYIVDKDGNVYEGRFGGEGVIGAHSGPGNNGSVGIAVLGDYEQFDVPEKAVSAVSSLIGDKSNLHKIDPTKKSIFRGENTENVLGHKDLMQTTCPGVYLYGKLPAVRLLAENYIKSLRPKFVLDYDYENKSDISFIELKPQSETLFTLKLENVGKINWNEKTYLILDTNSALNKIVSFPNSSGFVLARMNEKLVTPGQNATFTFSVKSGKIAEMSHMQIAPMINGFAKMRNYINILISVQQTDYRYKYIDSKYPEKSVKPNEIVEAWVKLQNTGNITWRKSGENTVVLGTDHERDHLSKFTSPPKSRIGQLQEAEVKPGDIGTFKMSLKMPSKPGYYQEYFTPIVEGVTWMQDSGLNFSTTVGGDTYEAEVGTKFGNLQFIQNRTYPLELKLRNTGQTTWKKSSTKISFINNKDMTISNEKLVENEVRPGETGTITFSATPSINASISRGAILIKPTVDNQQLLKFPVRIYYQVRKLVTTLSPATQSVQTPTATAQTSQATSNNDIRIKLGFSGNPTLTANTQYKIYEGSKLLSNISANQNTTITYKSGKYVVTTPTNTYVASSEIKLVPASNGIAKIVNYENRPAWNTSLNDNEFRGELEVRYIDGKLIVINQLPLETYLKGLGEVSDYEQFEKIKAVMVAARSYAYYYMTEDQKFAGKPYNLDDDPNVSQKYIGYGLEKRAPNVSKAVDQTKNEVVSYNDKVIKTPYFSQSDGTKTKSAYDVWGWTTTPYLVSVDDSTCKEKQFLGHGVGLSGCGSKGMAENGKTYKEILAHYYQKTKIKTIN